MPCIRENSFSGLSLLSLKNSSLKVCLYGVSDEILKNILEVLERGQNLLQNDIPNFAFRLSQSPEMAFQS